VTTRKPLPNRRSHETFSFEHWNMRYIVGVGRATPSAPISEVFLNVGKTGGQIETLARDSAVLLSLALQYGVRLSVLRHAITRNSDGSASGPVGALLDLMDDSEGGR
jgi:hypothetical protein